MKIREISNRVRTTPVAVYLAVFQVLLWRYSGESDFGVSIPVTNRSAPGLDCCLGYLTNLGIIRSQLDPLRTTSDFIALVGDQLLDILDCHEVPFPVIAKQLKRSGDDLQGPLLQLGFNFIQSSQQTWQFGGARLTGVDVVPRYLKNELKLDVQESVNGVRCLFLYDKDGFEASLIERMVGHYRVLLEAVVADPMVKLKDLPLLTQAERHQLLVEWNDTKAQYPSDKCIHQLFEDQVQRSPDAVALVFQDQQLTYAQLNAKANQLAHYLSGLGVKPDMMVAICVERSLEMVVGLLGILKAGGAYVPLDPEYPQERLAYMLADTAASVLLTQGRLKEQLPENTARMVCLDTDWISIGQHPELNPTAVTLSQHLAYCIYTSGSTGSPKGAMNSHDAVVNRLHWMQGEYALDATDVVLQKTPFSFDVSVWEFFWTLLTGARLVIAKPEGHKDPTYLVRSLRMFGVTTLHFVPSMLQAFLEVIDRDSSMSLRRVFCSGEALPRSLQEQFFGVLADVQLHNLYGPTEAAVDVTHWDCGADGFDDKVPIGHPISNTQIYLLNEWLQPVPEGVTGELYIGGVQLARGYLNRSDLTAEKFIPNPYGEPGSRMYRTGDLGRYLPDGNIEFLGRIDHQVKIRGFRIELGEIESTLLRHEGVRDAVVVAREDSPGDKRLVAYVVPREPGRLTIEALRAHLQKSLPEHMVPSSWVFLESLPLNANGKIDRKALPAPDANRADLGVEYVAPRTEMEQLLAGIWAEVLKVERVGIHDNFFALGGHSLLATQLVARTGEKTSIVVPVRVLFDAPTVSALAVQTELLVAQRLSQPASTPSIQRQARNRSQ